MNRWFKKQSRTDADAKLHETEPDRDEPRPVDDDEENVAPPTSRPHGVQRGDRPLKGGYLFIRERYRQEVEEAVASDKSRLVKYRSSASEEQEEEEEQEIHTEEQILGGYSGHEGYGLQRICLLRNPFCRLQYLHNLCHRFYDYYLLDCRLPPDLLCLGYILRRYHLILIHRLRHLVLEDYEEIICKKCSLGLLLKLKESKGHDMMIIRILNMLRFLAVLVVVVGLLAGMIAGTVVEDLHQRREYLTGFIKPYLVFSRSVDYNKDIIGVCYQPQVLDALFLCLSSFRPSTFLFNWFSSI